MHTGRLKSMVKQDNHFDTYYFEKRLDKLKKERLFFRKNTYC